ncbi:P2X purinoceptor 7 isoform X2 [Erpetoichthys calabaricus]|uniref:P2X purinoceptor 7 isoform X2 n=1 Tax=Erpetoichthys calabaricus TaxID=27687 RepID=UPI002234908C|nr:P2X purinoceptor 7 isoform X2 [Erpetoichthys calabaricus]
MGCTCRPLDFCEYETNKLVLIRSRPLGSLKWFLTCFILIGIGVMLFWNKEYQEQDEVISSVVTKVKGVALANNSELGEIVWDVADHSGQLHGKESFLVVTNAIITKNQRQDYCIEDITKNGKRCESNKDCIKGENDQHSYGIQTGDCVENTPKIKICRVLAWCPTEGNKLPPKPALFASAENFTVLIKNSIAFPNFNYTRRNILPEMNASSLKNCRYNKKTDPLCPVFRLGDIVKEAGENFTQMAIEGGIIGIQIEWDCNLDILLYKCIPQYQFRRLDERVDNKTVMPGLNFRFARYYKVNGVEERTLIKAYAIKFDVMVYGKAGKFNLINLILYIGSTLSYFGMATVLIDFLITTKFPKKCCMKIPKNIYKQKKYEYLDDLIQDALYVSFVDESHIAVIKGSVENSLQEVKAASVQARQHRESSRKQLSMSLKDQDVEMQEVSHLIEKKDIPSWCHCGHCCSAPTNHEQLCCRRSNGQCITTSELFSRLVLDRRTLELALLYEDPLLDLCNENIICKLRHCAYRQYIEWRFGSISPGGTAVVPRCCVNKVRHKFPSASGHYKGLCLEKKGKQN